jgi:hypothetical protein
MAQVTIAGDDLIVDVEGLDKLWALKSRLTVPLGNVRGATADPGIVRSPKGIRAPGYARPRRFRGGSFYADGERVFWDVPTPTRRSSSSSVTNRYARLVIEVDDRGNGRPASRSGRRRLG